MINPSIRSAWTNVFFHNIPCLETYHISHASSRMTTQRSNMSPTHFIAAFMTAWHIRYATFHRFKEQFFLDWFNKTCGKRREYLYMFDKIPQDEIVPVTFWFVLRIDIMDTFTDLRTVHVWTNIQNQIKVTLYGF